MRRLKKGKKSGSNSKPSSKVNDAAEAAQACASNQMTGEGMEAYVSSPTGVEGTGNGENAEEITKSEGNAPEDEDNGVNAAEKQEEDNCCVDGGSPVEGEVNGSDAADELGVDDYLNEEENKENEVDEVDGSDAADEVEGDDDYLNEDENRENEVDEVDGSDAVDEVEGEDDYLNEEEDGENEGDEVNGCNADDEVEGNDDYLNEEENSENEVEDVDCIDKENDGDNDVETDINEVNATEKQEENGNCVDEKITGENAVEEEVSGGNAAVETDINEVNATEKQEENGNFVDEKITGENAVEEEVSGGNAADEQQGKGNFVDEKNNGENAGDCEGNTEECMVEQEENNEQDTMEGENTVGLNKGTADESENKQDAVEEGKGQETGKEQEVGMLEKNSEQQNKTPRKRIRRKKWAIGTAGKVAPLTSDRPELRPRKKLKRIENDTNQDSQNQGAGASETDNNKETPVVGVKEEEKVAADIEDGRENVKMGDEKEVGESSKKRIVDLKKLKRRNDVAERASNKVISIGEGRGPLGKNKTSKNAETKGMIFMCSSKTKEDCFRYKVLGLPAGKRNMVEKIYNGMKLFLYDVDLKLLYGIYKAAGRGGYNIVPEAFNSMFPSQVRFKIFEDCLPVPEDKFRKVIKDNYYTKTKFDCQLSLEQVINLRKLFVTTGKITRSKKLIKRARAEKKRLDQNRIRQTEEVRRPSQRDELRQGLARDEVRRPPLRDRVRHAAPRDEVRRPAPRDEVRRRPALRDERRHYECLSPVAFLPTSSTYAYDRTVQREPYRQEAPVETRRSYSPSHLLDLQGALRQEPRIEQRRIYREEQMLAHHDLYRQDARLRPEPLLELRDSYRREPLLEHGDPYRREALLEHSGSYRQEQRESLLDIPATSYRRGSLLDHHDLYRQDERLEQQLDRRLPNLEARYHREIDGRDLHGPSYREQHPTYSDRIYSSSRPLEYSRGVDVAGEGQSSAYGSRKGSAI